MVEEQCLYFCVVMEDLSGVIYLPRGMKLVVFNTIVIVTVRDDLVPTSYFDRLVVMQRLDDSKWHSSNRGI